MIEEFKHKGWHLHSALDAIYAYDMGATDSGVSDPELRAAVLRHLRGLSDDELRIVLAYVGRKMLAGDRIRAGYGLAEVVSFAAWIDGFIGESYE